MLCTWCHPHLVKSNSVLPLDSGGITFGVTFGMRLGMGEKKFFLRQSGDNFGGGKPSSQDRYEGEQNISVKSPFKCTKTPSLRTEIDSKTN